MKRFYNILLCVLLTTLAYGQTDSKPFAYQGYAFNDRGDALPLTEVNVRFSIYPIGEANVYQENQVLTTDDKGVFVTTIGEQNPANFSSINFNAKAYGIRIELKRVADADYVIISDDAFTAVPYAKNAANGAPVGTVVAYGGSLAEIPQGWKLCDGASVSKTEYEQLFTAIGGAWGESGGNFNLPDMRGMFLRGVSGSTNNDPDKDTRTASNTGGNTGNTVGTVQTDAMKQHNHTMNSAGAHTHSLNNEVRRWSRSFIGSDDADHTLTTTSGEWVRWTTFAGDHTHTINNTGGSESRPKNANVYFIIKY